MANGGINMRSWWWLFSILGGIAGAFSCVSIIENVLDVGLHHTMRAILEGYRTLIHPLMDLCLAGMTLIWPNWSIPDWLKDLYALSFLGAGAFFRYIFIEMVRDRIKHWVAFALVTPAALLTGLLMLGLGVLVVSLWLVIALAIHRRRSYLDTEQIETYFGILAGLGTALFGAAVFFLINAPL